MSKIANFPFKVGAHDLDNTLLSGSSISQLNVEAVGVLAGNGLTNMIATGRNFHHAVGYHNQLGLKGPLVSSDGACVSIPGGAILHEQPLPLDVSPLLLELAETSGVSCLCFFRHGVYVTSKFDWNDNMQRHSEMGDHFRVVNVAKMRNRAVYKTLLFANEPARLDDMQAAVSQTYGTMVDVIRNGPHTLELLCKGVSKVSGLKVVAAHLGLEAEDFAVFGDGNNDIGMFGWAGFSVCMHHGSAQAKAAAKMIAPESSADINFAAGVAAFVDAMSS